MKLIDDEGDLFGVVNLVDAFVVVTVLLLMVGVAAVLFAPNGSGSVTETGTANVTIELSSLSKVHADDVPKPGTNATVLVLDERSDPTVPGTVEAVRQVPATVTAVTANGTVISQPHPTHKDVYLSVSITTLQDDSGTVRWSSGSLRVGNSVELTTARFQADGTVVGLDSS